MVKTVTYKVDLAHPPALTNSQKAQIKALEDMPDSAIDYSDIAPLDDNFWHHAIRNPYCKPVKIATRR